MQRWMIKLRPLAVGGVTLGILQGVAGIDWNTIWFQFIVTWINSIISAFIGAGSSGATSSGGGLLSLLQGLAT